MGQPKSQGPENGILCPNGVTYINFCVCIWLRSCICHTPHMADVLRNCASRFKSLCDCVTMSMFAGLPEQGFL